MATEDRLVSTQRYAELIAREASHWGTVRPRGQGPQIWEDDRLFAIYFGKEHELLIERVVTSGRHVLDLGCGEGSISIELAQRGVTVTGIDLSPERIDRARSKADEARLQDSISFLTGDLNTITLPENRYDCVVANDALHHLLHLDHVLEEVKKTLKPGGRLVVLDYTGIGRWRKVAAAILYAVLPTYKPYREKWKLASRLRAFLATEQTKRESLSTKDSSLHPDSPFEEISQESIVPTIQRHFTVTRLFSFNPFSFYLIAKVRMPQALRYRLAVFLRHAEDRLVNGGILRGAYIFVEATA